MDADGVQERPECLEDSADQLSAAELLELLEEAEQMEQARHVEQHHLKGDSGAVVPVRIGNSQEVALSKQTVEVVELQKAAASELDGERQARRGGGGGGGGGRGSTARRQATTREPHREGGAHARLGGNEGEAGD